jgi:hypothetical protein
VVEDCQLAVLVAGEPYRTVPVARSETIVGGLPPGEIEVVLQGRPEASMELDPPVFDLRQVATPDSLLDLDRRSVTVGGTARAEISLSPAAVAADLTVLTPVRRLAVTPLPRNKPLPASRAFVSPHRETVGKVHGIVRGSWLLELLDDASSTVWWQQLEYDGVAVQLVATDAVDERLLTGGGELASPFVLEALLPDGRRVPWLRFPARRDGDRLLGVLPDGRYAVSASAGAAAAGELTLNGSGAAWAAAR